MNLSVWKHGACLYPKHYPEKMTVIDTDITVKEVRGCIPLFNEYWLGFHSMHFDAEIMQILNSGGPLTHFRIFSEKIILNFNFYVKVTYSKSIVTSVPG